MKNSKSKLMSVCVAIAILCAMLASCADHSKSSGIKDAAETKPPATTTEAETTAEPILSEEMILSKADENGIAVIGTTAYIATSADLDLWSYAETIQDNYDKYSGITKLVIGEVEIDVTFECSTSELTGTEVRILATAIRALGYEKVFDKPEYMYGNCWDLLITTDEAIIWEKCTYGSGIKLIFTQYGMEEIDDSYDALRDDEKAYVHPIISFKLREDGKIGYTRQPQKYIAIQDVSGILGQCVSRDELYKETGYVSFNEGKVEYHTETKETVGEVQDLESCFEVWLPDLEKSPGIWADIKTLDQLLEYNSTLYDEFK